MYLWALNPTILHLGPLEIRWYGVMYLLGFLATLYYCKARIKAGKLRLTEVQLDDLLGQLVIAMIVGARLAYALFYNPTYFAAQPWKILFVWEGGLSFHGGLVAMMLVSWRFAKKHKLTFLHLADNAIVPLALANGFGRIGNFINGELYGIPTTLPWGVLFPNADLPRHPTQVYESAYNFLIAGVLYSQQDKKHKEGWLFGFYLILYGICRFSVEFLKDCNSAASCGWGPLTMGQWLTIPVFVAGVWLVLRTRNA